MRQGRGIMRINIAPITPSGIPSTARTASYGIYSDSLLAVAPVADTPILRSFSRAWRASLLRG